MTAWIESSANEDVVKTISSHHHLPPAMARVLAGRGFVCDEVLARFLQPRLSEVSDPFLLPGMSNAVERIWKAMHSGERVVVFGDYDVDGITSTALVYEVFKAMGMDVATYLPHRVEEGYGLSPDALDNCLTKFNPGLIVTVDCGTGSADAVRRARERNVDIVVTDHHHVGTEVAPAVAVVNPRLGTNEDLACLAGVGVAFKLAHALGKKARREKHPFASFDLRPFLELVAIGTVADLVPLKGENRILVKAGLRQLAGTNNIGIRALMEKAGVRGEVDAYHIGFQIGPRLNAAGRLGTAERALSLLLETDPDRARQVAEELDDANRSRQEIEQQTLEKALADIQTRFGKELPYTLVTAGSDWHPGVVGIVASRITQQFFRPAIVATRTENKTIKGSCRSIPGFHMVEALDACKSLLKAYGGHAMAAGIEMPENNLPAFLVKFESVARDRLKPEELVANTRIDAWIALNEANDELLVALERIKPFGFGNPAPVWGIREASAGGAPRILKDKHLKFTAVQGAARMDVMGWNMSSRTLPAGRIDLAGKISENVFMGKRTIQMSLSDMRPSK